EFFDLPSEALGEQKLPFSLSCAVGPGKDGTVVGLGRTEHLRAFLSGQTEGRLRAQANNTLSRRGQVWFFMAVPKDAGRNLAGGRGAGGNFPCHHSVPHARCRSPVEEPPWRSCLCPPAPGRLECKTRYRRAGCSAAACGRGVRPVQLRGARVAASREDARAKPIRQ